MEEKRISVVKAIRLKCIDCRCGSKKDVRLCRETECPLHPFRMGKDPNRAGIVNGGSFMAKNHGSTADF